MFKITGNPDQDQITAILFKRAVSIADLNLPAFDPATVRTADWTPATVEEIAAAAFEVAAAGEDPAADKNVQALLTSKLLANTIGGMYHRNQVALFKGELEYYRHNAPALLDQLREEFQTCVRAMKEAAAVIGHMELQDALRQAPDMRQERAAHVMAAYSANGRTKHLLDALPTIAAAAHGKPLNESPKFRLLNWTKPSLNQFNDNHLHGQNSQNMYGRPQGDCWDLINDGVPVELATTPSEVQTRIRRIERDADELTRDRRAEEAAHGLARAQANAFRL